MGILNHVILNGLLDLFVCKKVSLFRGYWYKLKQDWLLKFQSSTCFIKVFTFLDIYFSITFVYSFIVSLWIFMTYLTVHSEMLTIKIYGLTGNQFQ